LEQGKNQSHHYENFVPFLFSFASCTPSTPRPAALLCADDTMDDTHYQSFRAQSSSKVVTIPTRHDPKSGQRVVRWKDIQQYFENAKGILNGKYSVVFLTDDDLEE
jgi:hypothetical protein